MESAKTVLYRQSMRGNHLTFLLNLLVPNECDTYSVPINFMAKYTCLCFVSFKMAIPKNSRIKRAVQCSAIFCYDVCDGCSGFFSACYCYVLGGRGKNSALLVFWTFSEHVALQDCLVFSLNVFVATLSMSVFIFFPSLSLI